MLETEAQRWKATQLESGQARVWTESGHAACEGQVSRLWTHESDEDPGLRGSTKPVYGASCRLNPNPLYNSGSSWRFLSAAQGLFFILSFGLHNSLRISLLWADEDLRQGGDSLSKML